jgi:protein arginine N-methyltransferase 1
MAVSRDATMHGISVWFDSELSESISVSNAPGQPRLIYGTGFFPITEPTAVCEGDAVGLELRANLVNDTYIWQWNTTIRRERGDLPREFRQSSLAGAPLSLERLHALEKK